MTVLRKHLSTLAALWMLFQVVGMPASTLITPGHPGGEVCTCPDAAHGAVCPMHHKQQQQQSTSNDHRCRLQNAAAPLDAALLSLASGAGMLPPVISVVPSEPASMRVPVDHADGLSRAYTPDSPPPRA